MRKKFSIILTMLMSVICIAGCSEKADTSAASNDNTDTEKSSVNIVFGIVDSTEQATYKAAVKFKEAVEADSNGAITVDIYPNGTLGGDTASVEGVSQGTMQMACPVTSSFTMYDDKWGIFDMPFLFDSAESCFTAMDGELGQQLAATVEEQNIKVLGYAYNGARSISNSKHPINTPDDLAGIKIRVMESPVYIEAFNMLGANATPMAYSELFTGLQQGTVDAQDNSPDNVYKAKFYEVQDYYSLTEHVHSPFAMIMSLDFYNSLPDDYKTIIDENAREWLVDWERQTQIDADESSLQALIDEGVEVNKISDENLQLFKDKLVPLYEEYEEKFGEDFMDLAKSYN